MSTNNPGASVSGAQGGNSGANGPQHDVGQGPQQAGQPNAAAPQVGRPLQTQPSELSTQSQSSQAQLFFSKLDSPIHHNLFNPGNHSVNPTKLGTPSSAPPTQSATNNGTRRSTKRRRVADSPPGITNSNAIKKQSLISAFLPKPPSTPKGLRSILSDIDQILEITDPSIPVTTNTSTDTTVTLSPVVTSGISDAHLTVSTSNINVNITPSSDTSLTARTSTTDVNTPFTIPNVVITAPGSNSNPVAPQSSRPFDFTFQYTNVDLDSMIDRNIDSLTHHSDPGHTITNPGPDSNTDSPVDISERINPFTTILNTAILIPNPTPNVENINNLVDRIKKVTFQTDETHDNFSVSLQEKLTVTPAALPTWRSARSNLSAEAKAQARMAHIDQLINQGLLPGWAIGIDPIPGFLEPCIDEFVRLKRHHGIEVLQLAKTQLLARSKEHSTVGQACLLTCETIYAQDPEAWNRAKDLLSTLVGGDKARCTTGLNKRQEYVSQHAISNKDIIDLIQCTPRNKSRRAPLRNKSRSRSRSPFNQASRGRQQSAANTAPVASTSQAQPPRPTNGFSRGRGRGGRRSRSNSKTRGAIQFSRSNINGRARSPTNSNARSTFSLWNEDQNRNPQARGRAARGRGRSYTLTSKEAAFMEAYRSAQNGE